jgi:Domain of unknown function (DUF1731)
LSSVAWGRSSLVKMLLMCLPTAFSVATSRPAIAALERPLGHQREHLALPRRQPLERPVAPGCGDQPRHHLRVQDRAAGGHLAQRGQEALDVGDAVLEQVADRALAAREQLAGVQELDVLAEHEHREPAPHAPGLDGGGARVIRTETELVLKSRWVHPGVLLDSGFDFAHPTLPEALHAIAGQTPRGILPVALG